MFGDNITNFSQEVSVNNNKITIPKITGVESEDTISFIYDLKRTKLLLYSVKELEESLNHTNEKLKEKRLTHQITEKKYRRYIRFLLNKLYLDDKKCDSKMRVKLPSKAIEHFNITDKVYMVGKDTHLELFPSKEVYDEEVKSFKL